MDKRQDMGIYCIQETYFRSVDTYRLKVRGWKKLFQQTETATSALIGYFQYIYIKTNGN